MCCGVLQGDSGESALRDHNLDVKLGKILVTPEMMGEYIHITHKENLKSIQMGGLKSEAPKDAKHLKGRRKKNGNRCFQPRGRHSQGRGGGRQHQPQQHWQPSHQQHHGRQGPAQTQPASQAEAPQLKPAKRKAETPLKAVPRSRPPNSTTGVGAGPWTGSILTGSPATLSPTGPHRLENPQPTSWLPRPPPRFVQRPKPCSPDLRSRPDQVTWPGPIGVEPQSRANTARGTQSQDRVRSSHP